MFINMLLWCVYKRFFINAPVYKRVYKHPLFRSRNISVTQYMNLSLSGFIKKNKKQNTTFCLFLLTFEGEADIVHTMLVSDMSWVLKESLHYILEKKKNKANILPTARPTDEWMDGYILLEMRGHI